MILLAVFFLFAEFSLAATAAQLANLDTAVYFSNVQIWTPVLTIQVAVRVDTTLDYRN